jgi:2,3-bisphosphoglycerate-dependent phosphoglycerate mutase
MGTLILLRHGQSLWNAANKFTGWVDVPLSERGRAEATIASCKLKDKGHRIDVCFTSQLFRAMETAVICLTECPEICGGKTPIFQHTATDTDWQGWNNYVGNRAEELPILSSVALDERYYGDLQGLNKAQTAVQYGEEQVNLWRRSFSVRPPHGESLEDTLNRVQPYFSQCIFPHLCAGETALVAAHGNSLRAIIMHLEALTPEQVVQLELITGVPIVYTLDSTGKIQTKEILDK